MNKKGYTLIETIIVMALIGIIVTVIASLYTTGLKTYSEEVEKTNLQVENRVTLNRLKNDLLQGYRIEPGWTDPDDSTVYTTSENTVVIAVPAIDSNNDWIYSGNTPDLDHIVYFKDGDNLYKRVEASNSDPDKRKISGPSVEATYVSSLIFSYDQDPGTGLVKTVTADMTLARTIRGRNVSTNYKTTVSLRNK